MQHKTIYYGYNAEALKAKISLTKHNDNSILSLKEIEKNVGQHTSSSNLTDKKIEILKILNYFL